MQPHLATRADAAHLAKSLNVQSELVWQIIEGIQYSSYAELETAVHNAFLPHGKHHHLHPHDGAQQPEAR